MSIHKGAAYAFIEKWYQGLFRHVISEALIQTTSTFAVASNPERVQIVMVNLSANAIYLAPNAGVASTYGLRLGPTGGIFSFNVFEDAILPTLEWYGLSTAADQRLWILSVERDVYVPTEG